MLGCKEETSSPDAGPAKNRKLEIEKGYGPGVPLAPGKEAQLRVKYSSLSGAAISRALVRFAIFGDPSGSTLSSDRAVTDAGGVAVIIVRAGAGTSGFRVTATAQGADDAVFNVEVSDKGHGAISVSSRYSGTLPQIQLTSVTHFMLPGGGCAGVDPMAPTGILRTRKAASLNGAVLFTAITLGSPRAVLVRAATSAGLARAAGCVEIPGTVLKADRVLTLAVELRDLPVRIKGSYQLDTVVTLPGGGASAAAWPRPVATALSPWEDLSDCKLDPAQALLDCVVDAMDSADPLDCVVAQPGAPAAAIQAERGALTSGCRGAHTVRATPSLDQLTLARMNTTGSATLTALAKVGAAARSQLARISLRSILTLTALSRAGKAVARHELESISLGQAGTASTFRTSEIGLATYAAYPVEASVDSARQLKLSSHQLSLRPGLLFREALSRGVLKPAGLPTGTTALVNKLVGLLQVTSSGKTLTGCDALQAVVCAAARLGPTCLGQACKVGSAALASRLDSGFTGLDKHAGADLTLAGEVSLKDDDGDLKIDSLGSAAVPGLWKMILALGAEKVTPGEAKFTGKPGGASAP